MRVPTRSGRLAASVLSVRGVPGVRSASGLRGVRGVRGAPGVRGARGVRGALGALGVLALTVGMLAPTAPPATAQSLGPTAVDDSLRHLQWNLDRIEAPRAWSITRGDPEVTIAVVDTGIDDGHRDLAGAFWVDEGTGARGFNHVDGSFETYLGRDADWHGTAVAGVAAARADDGYGMAGVAPNVRVMVQRIYGSTDYGIAPTDVSYLTAINAIGHATDAGADVILLTWNGRTTNPDLLAAIEASGVPVVVAAGNDGQDLSDSPGLSSYPAMYQAPNLVTVAASDREDRLLSNDRVRSNYGVRTVDLAAPGEDIVGLSASASHDLFEGTSFAAPQVAAALALGRSLDPDASAGQLVSTVVRTARLSPHLTDVVTSGGVLDVAAFLRGLDRPACGEGIPPVEFDDLSRSSTHVESIDCVVWYGIARGIDADHFAPHRTITRGETATFLARVLEAAGHQVAEESPVDYTDIEGTTHAGSIATVTAAGIARGIGDGRFGPTEPVTRGQMATMVVAAVELLVAADLTTDRDWFDDVAGTTHERAILIARDLEITRGTSDVRTFEPDRDMPREQMASFITKTLDELGRRDVSVTRLP